MESKIRALKYQVEQVGKHIKSTKKRYFWSLCIGQRYYNFVLDDSLVSGKSKLSINGKVFHQNQQTGIQRCQYDHSFIIEGCLFNLCQNQSGFQMRVNNKLFTHMLTQEMGANSFENHKVDQSAFELSGKIKPNQSKKITLNLPGMSNGMKKKKGVAQSDNWNDFAGSNNFPNYFGQTQIKKPLIQAKVESPSLPETKAAQIECTKQQFSTLHNLFKTITASGQYVQKSAEGTPTYEISQIPSIPQINLQEFNTMQNLFSTINNTQLSPKQQEPKVSFQSKPIQDLFSTLKVAEKQKKQLKPSNSQINTQVFKTKIQDFDISKSFNAKLPKQAPFATINQQNLNQYNVNDFNTLQNLFATGLNIPKQAPTAQPPQKSQQEQFFTIKCSFQSNFQNKIENNNVSQQKISNLSKININDFNTMQHLFATNIQKDALGSTDKVNKVEQPLKTQNIPNQLDFNTMQNLFATKGGKAQSNENNFWQF